MDTPCNTRLATLPQCYHDCPEIMKNENFDRHYNIRYNNII